jgi:hypothetical protein
MRTPWPGMGLDRLASRGTLPRAGLTDKTSFTHLGAKLRDGRIARQFGVRRPGRESAQRDHSIAWFVAKHAAECRRGGHLGRFQPGARHLVIVACYDLPVCIQKVYLDLVCRKLVPRVGQGHGATDSLVSIHYAFLP